MRFVAAEVERPQRRQRTAHGLAPEATDTATAQQRVQGQQSVQCGVREQCLDPLPHFLPFLTGWKPLRDHLRNPAAKRSTIHSDGSLPCGSARARATTRRP